MVAIPQNLVFLILTTTLLAKGDPQVPCYFVFGDSLMDNGNNNRLFTHAKVNFPPYGIDFPDGPTGRFTNGRNTADVIANYLGSIISFRLLLNINWVNYASGAAGIRADTARHLGDRISFDRQIKNHWNTVLRLSHLIGKGSLDKKKKYLKKCIYTVGMGNNNFLNNSFLPKYYNTSSVYTPEQYAEVLAEQYSQQLQDLYKSGARMFGIFAAGYSSCTPGIMAEFGMNSCVHSVNKAVTLFNSPLNTALNDLNNKLLDAKFILLESSLEYPNDINVTDRPCCGVSSSSGKGQCAPNQVPCNNRENYYFWDSFHPTERINVIAGTNAYKTLSLFYATKAIALSKDDKTGYISDA